MFISYVLKKMVNGIVVVREIYGSVLKNTMKKSLNLGLKVAVHLK